MLLFNCTINWPWRKLFILQHREVESIIREWILKSDFWGSNPYSDHFFTPINLSFLITSSVKGSWALNETIHMRHLSPYQSLFAFIIMRNFDLILGSHFWWLFKTGICQEGWLWSLFFWVYLEAKCTP